MEYLLITTHDDSPLVKEFLNSLVPLELEELIEAYNRQVVIGIVGVRKQALYNLALGIAFKRRTGQSPVRYELNVLSLTGKIAKDGDGFSWV
jgi:hypothetical protein